MPRDRSNSWQLEGRLTADPQNIGSGDNAGVRFTIANDTSYYSRKDEGYVTETCFVDITAWGKIAERVRKYRKGEAILAEGYFQTTKRESDGKTKSYTNHQLTSLRKVTFLPDDGSSSGSNSGNTSSSSSTTSQDSGNAEEDSIFG